MYYKVCLTTKINPTKIKEGSGILVIEPDDYKDNEIKQLKNKGYKVLAYLSVGTIEKERNWFNTYSKYKLKQLEDWSNEYYINITKTAWKNFLIKRAITLSKRGFSGLWLDNIDVYSEYHNKKMYTACYGIIKALKSYSKGYIMLNGGSEFLDDTIDNKNSLNIIDGYTQEEVFSNITNYSGTGTFGKQNSNDKKFYKTLIKKLIKKQIDCFLLEYTKDKNLKNDIKTWCKNNKVNYYISEKVNL